MPSRAAIIASWAAILAVVAYVIVDAGARAALAVVVVLLVLIGAAIASTGPMAQIEVEDGHLTVRLNAPHSLFALKARIRIPLAAVERARVADARSLSIGVRLPGTSVPGLYTAGSYGVGARRSFWLVRRAKRVLVVELRGTPFRRLVLEVPDPETLVERITGALTGS